MISIHALVKRATLGCIVLRLFYVISIHALVKRATRAQRYPQQCIAISIHALVKRATFYRVLSAVVR